MDGVIEARSVAVSKDARALVPAVGFGLPGNVGSVPEDYVGLLEKDYPK